MEVRKLTRADIINSQDSLLILLSQAQDVSFPKSKVSNIESLRRLDALKEYIDDGSAVVLGAYNQKQLLGIMWLYLKNKDIVHINSFVIDKESRGTGVGKLIWQELEEFMKLNSFSELELLVTVDNAEAIHFYEKRNFEVERLVMRKRFAK